MRKIFILQFRIYIPKIGEMINWIRFIFSMSWTVYDFMEIFEVNFNCKSIAPKFYYSFH